MVECHTCGWVPKCDNCDVSLTLHKNMNQLSCHYCGFTYAVPSQCPNCNETNLRGRGYGTEKVEDLFEQLFPDAKIARMDLDTTRTKNASFKTFRWVNPMCLSAHRWLLRDWISTK